MTQKSKTIRIHSLAALTFNLPLFRINKVTSSYFLAFSFTLILELVTDRLISQALYVANAVSVVVTNCGFKKYLTIINKLFRNRVFRKNKIGKV